MRLTSPYGVVVITSALHAEGRWFNPSYGHSTKIMLYVLQYLHSDNTHNIKRSSGSHEAQFRPLVELALIVSVFSRVEGLRLCCF